MNHWQDWVAMSLVGVALVAFVWHFVRGLFTRQSTGCDSCCGCTSRSASDLITLHPPEQDRSR